ncbi:adenine/guanine phosphoribosyltransferase-like PRPP-binding protein [Elusimicrobium posterum]|uniref:hypothetical protein n=1 Tax=Elusimicrobium posterum TaxID=3116653 RepID=UPI003C778BAB
MTADKIKEYIFDVYDFPQKGVLFKDITPLLQNGAAFKKAVELLIKDFEKENITKVVGVDSRGFYLPRRRGFAGRGFCACQKKRQTAAQNILRIL